MRVLSVLLWLSAFQAPAPADQIPGPPAAAPQPPAGTAPVRLKGRIKDSDYPAELGRAGIGGSVEVRYTVGLDGRVTNCRIVVPTRAPQLDAVTCRLITKRFRFRPAKDPQGRDIAADIIETHDWVIARRP